MPELTSDDAVSGFNGFTVVFARLKETTPAMQKKAPISASADAAIICEESPVSIPGAPGDIPHIASPKMIATTGGGILFSSIRILFS